VLPADHPGGRQHAGVSRDGDQHTGGFPRHELRPAEIDVVRAVPGDARLKRQPMPGRALLCVH
jgi:hypothetical protein